ncbi:MAG: DUF1553 domain-containing protein, partial [Verrucomicrobiota bacterium]
PYTEQPIKDAEAFYQHRQKISDEAKRVATGQFDAWLNKTKENLPKNYQAWKQQIPIEVKSAEGTRFSIEPDGTVLASGPNPRQDDYRVRFSPPSELKRVTGWTLEVLPHDSHTEGKLSRGQSGDFILTNVKLLVQRKGSAQVRDIAMRNAVADAEDNVKGRKYGKVKDTLDDDPRNGWTTTAKSGQSLKAVFELAEPLELHPDDEYTWVLFHRSTNGDANIGRFRISVTDQIGETVTKIGVSPMEELAQTDKLTDELKTRLLNQFLLDDEHYQSIRDKGVAAHKGVGESRDAQKAKNVQVLAERAEPRTTHILERGVWDAKGEVVMPAVLPAVLDLPKDQAMTRLDLAKWIVSPENPLTSRVIVNHLWQIMFGQGLVRTPEDFGLQGELPTHPELLDWLAIELVESGWDLRHILKLIATSETYRQSSYITPESLERDPENRLLARGARYRPPAWMIRDSALQSSGLLNPTVGGHPVRPWQPEGVWNEIFMGRFTYQPSVGPAQYRRTLYAFWRRSSAPTFLFDSSQRRVCEVGIRRTNTPLHALTLLNDTTTLEASRVIAEESASFEEMAKRILSRALTSDEAVVIEREYQKTLNYYLSEVEQALQLLSVGQQDMPEADAAPEMAARMTVASMLLNLDEAITHE